MASDSGRIVAAGLTKHFGSATAVDDLSFTAEPGSITGFLGPNGAGKTTTLRMLVGLVAPDAGRATIGGRAYDGWPAPLDQVGAVLESSGFHPRRSGRDHLRVYSTTTGCPDGRADELLAMVGLTGAADRPVGGYSLGMKQRLALATALLGDPPVLVLDEPANGLDPQGIAWIRALLRDLAADGRTILVSSHVLSEVQQVVDHVVIINRGALVRQGTLHELAADAGTTTTVHTPQVDQLAAALARTHPTGVRVERSGADGLRVHGVGAVEIGRLAHREQIELHGLAAEPSDLERLFFQLTAASVADGDVLEEAS